MQDSFNLAGGLRAVLALKGMTMTEFAAKAGVGTKSIYEQLKRNNVYLSTLARYAAALDLSLWEFIKACEDAKKQVARKQR